MDVDQHFWLRRTKSSQDAFSFGLYRARNGRIIRCQDHLNTGVGVRRYDVFNQTERDNVAAKSRIFYCAQCFPDLLPRDGHVRQPTLPHANGKNSSFVLAAVRIRRRYACSKQGLVCPNQRVCWVLSDVRNERLKGPEIGRFLCFEIKCCFVFWSAQRN